MPGVFFKIIERPKIEKQSRSLYFVVGFWRNKQRFLDGRAADHTNDFTMQSVKKTGIRIVTRPVDGFLKDADGNFHDPVILTDPDPNPPPPVWERESFDRNMRQEVRQTIRRYLQRYKQRRQQNKQIRRDDRMPVFEEGSDPDGLLTTDVLSMENEEGEDK